MGFGQAVEHDRALGHAFKRRHAQVRTIIGQLPVDLVTDHPQVVTLGDQCHGFQFFTGVDIAGRVVRRGQGNAARLIGHQRFERGQGQAKIFFRRLGNRHQPRTRCLNARGVGQVHRRRHQHLITVLEQAHRGGIQTVLRPGHQGDVVSRHRLSQQGRLLGGNRFTQYRATDHVGVMGVPLRQSLYRRCANVIGGGEVRVADAQHDRIFTALLCLTRRVMNIPGRDGFTADALDHR
ncbi:hypothetical protein D3C78_861770 [compost metagenome]